MLFIHEYAAQVDTRSQSTQSAAEADDARAKAHDELSPGEPPEKSGAAQSGKRYTVAAGIPAVVQTMKFGLGEMGVTRSLRSFLAVNKVNGVRLPKLRLAQPGHRPEGGGVL